MHHVYELPMTCFIFLCQFSVKTKSWIRIRVIRSDPDHWRQVIFLNGVEGGGGARQHPLSLQNPGSVHGDESSAVTANPNYLPICI